MNPKQLLDAAIGLGAGAARDVAAFRHPLSHGDDLDAWDPDYVRRTLPLWQAVHRTYFRAEVRGLENVPAEGPVLLVGNHSGGVVIVDTFIFAAAFYEHFGVERRFHQLAHDLAARMPPLGVLRRWGVVAARHENAEAAFERGAAVLVYPGGDHETFRPSWESAQIDFGGRKGFIRLALRNRVPIVPVVAMGGQETGLFLGRGRRVARATGFDRLTRIKVFPLTVGPPLGLTLLDQPLRLPLPAKITVQVLPPIDLHERFSRSTDVSGIYNVVSGEMQKALDGLAAERTLPVVG